MERDREKTLQRPNSDGLSMSTAAKTTPSVRLRLKEAQDKIGELRLALALAKHKTGRSQELEETPEDTLQNGTTQIGPPICVTHLCHFDSAWTDCHE
jgi:hypothetical protein